IIDYGGRWIRWDAEPAARRPISLHLKKKKRARTVTQNYSEFTPHYSHCGNSPATITTTTPSIMRQ
ncbi:MAG TPA: hypothetical protein VJP79_11190, partial [Nitrososphaera sp.]|nr:hypothetical protein [Nitrososphaera sp.]